MRIAPPWKGLTFPDPLGPAWGPTWCTHRVSSQPELPLPKRWDSTIHEHSHKMWLKKIKQKQILPWTVFSWSQDIRPLGFMHSNICSHWGRSLVLWRGDNSFAFSMFSGMIFFQECLRVLSFWACWFPSLPSCPTLIPQPLIALLKDLVWMFVSK